MEIETRPLLLGDMHTLSNIFVEVGPWTGAAPDLGAFTSDIYQKHERRRGRDTLRIGAYCTVRREDGRIQSLAIKRLGPKVLDRLREHMVILDDVTYFEIVEWSQGHALVVIHYNKISTAPWLAHVQDFYPHRLGLPD